MNSQRTSMLVAALLISSSSSLFAPNAFADAPQSVNAGTQDVLANCPQLNANGAVSLDQAAGLMNACLQNLYGGRAYSVTAVGQQDPNRLCPPNDQNRCIAFDEIVITIQGQVPNGDSVAYDLGYALAVRHGTILGFAVILAGPSSRI